MKALNLKWVEPKMRRVSGDNNPCRKSAAVSSSPKIYQVMRQFGMYSLKLLLFFFINFSYCTAQKESGIKLFTFQSPAMFNDSTIEFFKKKEFKDAKLLTDAEINPNRQKAVDSFNIIRYMNFFFPDSLSLGTCVLDIEDSPFYNLKSKSNSAEFVEEKNWFISVLDLLKKYRPNVNFGIYGIPFAVFYTEQMMFNIEQKFDEIFKHCDFIAPALYMSYSDEQVGHQRNLTYLHDNLQIELDYGYRLNKPVIPFIWELIHPSNKKYGGTIIPKIEYLDFVNFIIDYRYNGDSVAGLFLWNPGVPSPVYFKESFGVQNAKNKNESAEGNIKNKAIGNRDSLIIDYYKGILKILGKYK